MCIRVFLMYSNNILPHRLQSCKRRRSSSPDSSEELQAKHTILAPSEKRWRGTTNTEFQPELLEEMGVGMLPGVSVEVTFHK